MTLVDRRDLESLLEVPQNSLEGDRYTDIVIRSAENLVRDAARRPGWIVPTEGQEPGPGQTLAPGRAVDIALHLAQRAWSDTGNLQRRTTGATSETYFENGVRGLELTASERDWLVGQRPGASSGGLWVQYTGPSTPAGGDIYVPDEQPFATPILMDDGSTGWVYGEPTT